MKLPRDLNGSEVIKALCRLGFMVMRQAGSHVQLCREHLHVTVPLHAPVRIGTLKSILRQAQVTIEELVEAL